MVVGIILGFRCIWYNSWEKYCTLISTKFLISHWFQYGDKNGSMQGRLLLEAGMQIFGNNTLQNLEQFMLVLKMRRIVWSNQKIHRVITLPRQNISFYVPMIIWGFKCGGRRKCESLNAIKRLIFSCGCCLLIRHFHGKSYRKGLHIVLGGVLCARKMKSQIYILSWHVHMIFMYGRKWKV